MPRKSRSLSPDPLASFPPWARMLAERYYTKTISTFILHGAVRDLQPADDGKGGRRFISLRSFLADELFGTRDLVVFYDRSGGIRLATPEMQKDFMAAVSGYDTLFGTEYAKAVPKDPARAFPLLESFARVRIADGKSVAIIVDFAETVAPAGDLGYMPGEDRYSLVTLVKWAQDPQFLTADFSVCLIAENLAELNPRIGRNPYAASIELPLPDEKERYEYVDWKIGQSGKKRAEISDVNAEALAQMTAGMSRVALDRVLTEAIAGPKLTVEKLKEKKKEIIQAECHGLLEFNRAGALDRHGGRPRQGQTAPAPGGEGDPGRQARRGPDGLLDRRADRDRQDLPGHLLRRRDRDSLREVPQLPLAVARSDRGQPGKDLQPAQGDVAGRGDRRRGRRLPGQPQRPGDSGTSARVFSQIASFMGNTEFRGRSSGSCSPRGRTCCRWTSSGRGARRSTWRSSTRSRTRSASSW